MSDLPDRPLPLLFQASGAVDKVIPEWFYERFNTSQQIPVDPPSPSTNNFSSTESSKLSRVVSWHCRKDHRSHTTQHLFTLNCHESIRHKFLLLKTAESTHCYCTARHSPNSQTRNHYECSCFSDRGILHISTTR